MARRYDSEEYLAAWRNSGAYPDIHRPIVDLMFRHVAGRASVLDLCCSTGILGAQVARRITPRVVGIEGDLESIRMGRAYGIDHRIYPLTVTPDTWPGVEEIIREHGVGVVVARRCLSEIFAECRAWGPVFAAELRRLGVRQVFLQGRAFSKRSVHPIPNTAAEVALFGSSYRVAKVTPPAGSECAYLVAA